MTIDIRLGSACGCCSAGRILHKDEANVLVALDTLLDVAKCPHWDAIDMSCTIANELAEALSFSRAAFDNAVHNCVVVPRHSELLTRCPLDVNFIGLWLVILFVRCMLLFTLRTAAFCCCTGLHLTLLTGLPTTYQSKQIVRAVPMPEMILD